MSIGDGIAVAGIALALALMFMGVVIARMHAAELIKNTWGEQANISRKNP